MVADLETIDLVFRNVLMSCLHVSLRKEEESHGIQIEDVSPV
jgi:hypothetical protein